MALVLSKEIEIDPKDLVLEGGDSIGTGGFGEVYKGKWNNKENETKVVAVKKIAIDDGIPKRDLKKIVQEVDILVKLRHQNIVQIYGACFVETTENSKKKEFWIVTEFIEGFTLYDLLHESEDLEFQWDMRLSWAQQANSSVHFLHTYIPSIIHRDIKSKNFMITTDFSTVKLIDFGFAKHANVKSTQPRKCPTLRWGAPETLEYPPKWGPAADMYSLGFTFFEIAAKEIPFSEADDSRVKVFAQGSDRPPIPKDCPPEFENIICLCWNCDPKSRPTSANLIPIFELLCGGLVDNANTPLQNTINA